MPKTNARENYTLRISVTATCNLKCIYCNPSQLKDEIDDDTLLKIIKSAASNGIQKISWTGGEPTVRNNIVDIIKKSFDFGITKQSMTTNGVLFFNKAEELKKAGLSKINISLDTLDPLEYIKITKKNALSNVLKSIDKGIEVFGHAKLNHVVTKDNFHTIPEFVEFAQKYGDQITIRFLELVPCNNPSEKDENAFKESFISATEIKNALAKIGSLSSYKKTGDVPKSQYYKIDGKSGIFGINPNHSVGYHCDQNKCPKIRVSPNGYVSNCTTNLKYCHDFRHLDQIKSNELMAKIIKEKENRNYKGFQHKQKYYDFWRFGVLPDDGTLF